MKLTGFAFPIIPLVELAARFFSFLTIFLLARLLSPDDFGLYNYIVSFVLIISVFMDGGINTFIFTKSLKRELQNIHLYFSGKIFLSLVILLIFSLFVFIVDRKYFIPIFFYSVFVFFNSSIAFFKMLARGQECSKIDIQAIILDPFFRFLLLSLLFVFHHKKLTVISIDIILPIFAILEIFIFLYIFSNLRKTLKISLFISFNKTVIRNTVLIVLESKFFLLYYFCFVCFQRIDILFIKAFLGNKTVGFFTSAYNLYMITLLFFSSYITSEFRRILRNPRKYTTIMLLVYLLIALLFVKYSAFIYKIIYPREYLCSSIYLKYFAISLPFSILSYFIIHYMNFKGRTLVNAAVIGILLLIKILCLNALHPTNITTFIRILVVLEILMGTIFFLTLIVYNFPDTFNFRRRR
ncbi:oligosaccharide flippase family protein [Desulfurobacterium crinifex]